MIRMRAIILGLAGVILLAAVTFFNDMVMKGTYLVGNFLPLAVFGTLMVFVLAVNPLLRKVSRSMAFSGSELAVAVALVLFACCVPGRNLMHFFTNYMMLPNYHVRTSPAWQSASPAIRESGIKDWKLLAERLAGPAESGTAMALIRDVFPAQELHGIGAAAESGLTNQGSRNAIVDKLNSLIQESEFGLRCGHEGLELTTHVKDLLAMERSLLAQADIAQINRGIIDAAFNGAIATHRLGPLDRAPLQMRADVSKNTTVVLDGFVTGLAEGDRKIGWNEIPWYAWKRPLLFWIPLILTISLIAVGLGLVLHRQWSSYEHLPYPTVEFARALLPEADGRLSGIFYNRLFWIGFALVFVIHMNNYACEWWPDQLIKVKLRLDFSALLELVPVMKRADTYGIAAPTLFFTAIAFAYFLATDVSLSLGIAPYLFCLAFGILAGYGVSTESAHLKMNLSSSLYAGGYFGMFLILLYTGRRYYQSVFRRCVFIPTADSIEKSALWGGRLFLVSFILAVIQLVFIGADWQLAFLYMIGMIIIFTVMSRLLCEAGVFFVHAHFYPCLVLWGFMGGQAAGVDQLLILALISGLLMIDPRETMMPFAMSALCLVDREKTSMSKTAVWGLLGLVLALAVAVPVVLHTQYQRGAILTGDGWCVGGVPRFPYDINADIARKLDAQGVLEASQGLSGWEHFTNLSPDKTFMIGFGTTFGLVLLFSFLRHRFAWWPLHPLIFLVLGTWQSRTLAFSFLLGCGIKAAVTKYGGSRVYQNLKPLMIGLIAGEMLAALMPVVIGAIYYYFQGMTPKPFRIMPG